MATKEQPADHVNQCDQVRNTPSQQYPSVIISDNHLEAGAIQGVNIVNSTVNKIKIKGESRNDQLKTDVSDMAAEQKRQGETIEAIREEAVDLVYGQQITAETMKDIVLGQKMQGANVKDHFNTLQTELRNIVITTRKWYSSSTRCVKVALWVTLLVIIAIIAIVKTKKSDISTTTTITTTSLTTPVTSTTVPLSTNISTMSTTTEPTTTAATTCATTSTSTTRVPTTTHTTNHTTKIFITTTTKTSTTSTATPTTTPPYFELTGRTLS